MEMTMREMLGQKLVFGFHGTSLTPEMKALIREYKLGNVILFLRNVESGAQLRCLCEEIQALIQGETGMVKEDGLPRFVNLKRVFAK